MSVLASRVGGGVVLYRQYDSMVGGLFLFIGICGVVIGSDLGGGGRIVGGGAGTARLNRFLMAAGGGSLEGDTDFEMESALSGSDADLEVQTAVYHTVVTLFSWQRMKAPSPPKAQLSDPCHVVLSDPLLI